MTPKTTLLLALAIVTVAVLFSALAPPRRTIAVPPEYKGVELVAVAPDGTHLWRLMDRNRPVYFASSGTLPVVKP